MRAPRVAFYAPMKSPDHGVPSGDREMARLFLRLLQTAGYDPMVASRLRSHHHEGSRLAALGGEAEAEIARLLGTWQDDPPALWFTYHLYYKAPDLIGPAVARALAIPYVVAEGSRAAPRKAALWPDGHRAAEAGLDAADLVLILNPRDRELLQHARPARQALVDFPPFIDETAWPHPPRLASGARLAILVVAMMRPGDKLASYRLLAEALGLSAIDDWHLDIVGDGPSRRDIERLFAPFGDKVRYRGLEEDRAVLAELYAGADILAWPAVNEAFGMIFLEAALQGCPSVAGAFGGVANLVLDERTGLLSAPNDVRAFAAEIERLACDPALRRRLGAAARENVLDNHSLAPAASRLRAVLAPLLDGRPSP